MPRVIVAPIRATGATQTVSVTPAEVVVEAPTITSSIGSWPDNEPTGMTQIVAYQGGSDTHFDSNASYGGVWDTRVSIVSDSDAKFSNQALQKNFYVDDGDGWHGLATDESWGTSYRELYVRIVVKLSSNWDDHSGGQKFYYFGSDPGSSNDVYIYFKTTDAVNNQVRVVTQIDSPGPDGSDTFFAGGGIDLPLNEYFTIEVHIVAESAPGNSDGTLKLWYNDSQTGGYSGLQFFNSGVGAAKWDGYQGLLYWGGSGDTKTANDWVRYAEFYISGKN